MPWRVIGKETVDLSNYFCDTCGCEFSDIAKNISGKEGVMKILAEFGYGTKRDGDRYEYFLCEDCAGSILTYIEMLKKLKDTAIDV
jgi:hypothetical protein